MIDFEGNRLKVGDRVGYIDGSTARPVAARTVLEVSMSAVLLSPNRGAKKPAWVVASGRIVRLKDKDQ